MEIHRLDCRELRCPMPIVKVALRVRDLQQGEALVVQATDPAFLVDMQAWARLTGNELRDIDDGPTKQLTIIKVG